MWIQVFSLSSYAAASAHLCWVRYSLVFCLTCCCLNLTESCRSPTSSSRWPEQAANSASLVTCSQHARRHQLHEHLPAVSCNRSLKTAQTATMGLCGQLRSVGAPHSPAGGLNRLQTGRPWSPAGSMQEVISCVKHVPLGSRIMKQ